MLTEVMVELGLNHGFVRERCGGGHGQRKQQERRQSSESGGTEGQGDLLQDFPSGPVAKTPHFHYKTYGFP